MRDDVNCLKLPNGAVLRADHNDARARAEALRLGLLPGMMAQLNSRAGTHGVAGVARDGDKVVAVIAWAGFESPTDNGWGTLSISPATDDMAGWLAMLAHRIVGADTVRMEGACGCRN